MTKHNVVLISNELEFILDNVAAPKVIEQNGLPIVPEVNRRDIIELNVSKARHVGDLNRKLDELVRGLRGSVAKLGGRVHGGSSVLCDTSGLEPMWYRTTASSKSCARGFLDITSQQIVMGINDEEYGFRLYNYLRNISPALLALVASSPYRYGPTPIDTNTDSRRMGSYQELCARFPSEMWHGAPRLESLRDYRASLHNVSRLLNERLAQGAMDANWDELKRPRQKEGKSFQYYPFDTLEPHQVYWPIRVRPDHSTTPEEGNSLFSLEVRVPDIPTTTQRMQALNSLVAGLAYRMADEDVMLPQPYNGTFGDLKTAAQDGLGASINGNSMKNVIDELRYHAAIGLCGRGLTDDCQSMNRRIKDILDNGNDATLMRAQRPRSCGSLKDYLVSRLREGE